MYKTELGIVVILVCRNIDSILRIPISSRRTSSIFCIPDIIAFTNNRIPTIISKFTSIQEVFHKDIGIHKKASVLLLPFLIHLHAVIHYY